MSTADLFQRFLLVGGAFLLFQMVQFIWKAIKNGRIERRPGFKPVSPHDGAAIYWSFIGIVALGALISVAGMAVLIVDVIGH